MQKQIDRLIDILSHLREHPEGCPWTKEQTHQSLIPSLIEEAYETAETVDQGNVDADLCDELGDVLLQVVLHAQIASERKAFTFDDIARAISDKLTRRYPTILGDEPNTLRTSEEIDRRWNEIKAEERRAKGIKEEDASALDNVSQALPALMRAMKLKDRAAKTGFEWTDVSHVLDKIVEETQELRTEIEAKKIDKQRVTEELGDLMFMMVNFARWHDVDAEDALRLANNRFENRFRHMEKALKAQNKNTKSCTPDEWHALWNDAKQDEKLKKVG